MEFTDNKDNEKLVILNVLIRQYDGCYAYTNSSSDSTVISCFASMPVRIAGYCKTGRISQFDC